MPTIRQLTVESLAHLQAQGQTRAVLDEGARAIPQSEAQRYLRFAAMNGDAEACLLMGYCYAKGIGVPKNTTLMNSWLCLAAQQGGQEASGLIHVD